MPRVPTDQRTPLAQWFIRARESRNTQDADYTADRFLADLRAENSYAPSRSNYAQWESGKVTPRASNLEPVIRFWGKRGIAPPGEPETTADPMAAVLMALVEELRAWREEDRTRIARLEAMVDGLAAEALAVPGTPVAAGRPALRGSGG